MRLNLLKTLALSALVAASAYGCTGDSKDDKNDGSDITDKNRFNADAIGKFDDPVPVTSKDAGLDLDIEQAVDDENLNEVLPRCGITDLSNPDLKTFSTIMDYDYTLVIDAAIARADVGIKSILDLSGTLSETTLDVGVNVRSVAGTSGQTQVSDTSPIAQRAEDIAKVFRGPVTNYAVPRNSNFHDSWKGILCSVIGSERLVNLRNGFNTEVGFEPPIVPNISPIADRERYKKELGEFRFFKNISATVTSSSNPVLEAGRVYKGSILVEKIPATKLTASGLIKGDTAYRVTNFFETDEITLALGFHLWTEYYIDHAQRDFSAVIADVGDVEVMHFIGTYIGDGGGIATNRTATYEGGVKQLLSSRCAGCHNPQSDDRSIFFTYADALAKGADIASRVASGNMPTNEDLDDEEKKLIADWATAGFPEN